MPAPPEAPARDGPRVLRPASGVVPSALHVRELLGDLVAAPPGTRPPRARGRPPSCSARAAQPGRRRRRSPRPRKPSSGFRRSAATRREASRDRQALAVGGGEVLSKTQSSVTSSKAASRSWAPQAAPKTSTTSSGCTIATARPGRGRPAGLSGSGACARPPFVAILSGDESVVDPVTTPWRQNRRGQGRSRDSGANCAVNCQTLVVVVLGRVSFKRLTGDGRRLATGEDPAPHCRRPRQTDEHEQQIEHRHLGHQQLQVGPEKGDGGQVRHGCAEKRPEQSNRSRRRARESATDPSCSHRWR